MNPSFVMDATRSRLSEPDGSAQNAKIMTFARYVTMETNTTYSINFTGLICKAGQGIYGYVTYFSPVSKFNVLTML